MLAIFSTIKLGLKSFFKLLGIIENKQLMDAGRDAERGKRAENALDDIGHVKDVKKDVDDMSDDDVSNELYGNNDK